MRGIPRWRGLSSLAKTPHAVLDSLAATRPLKNAIKCFDVPAEKTLRWTYQELQGHTKALARGFDELGFKPGDKIAVWAPSASAEAIVTLLAASRCSLTAIMIDPPSPGSESLKPVEVALDEYSPKALILWHSFADPAESINELFPDLPPPKSGLASLIADSGSPLASSRYPSVQYVVHTGQSSAPHALSFRNLMVGAGTGPRQSPADDESHPFIVSAVTGETKSRQQITSAAEALASKLKLSGDQESVAGKIVLPTSSSSATVEALVAAFSTETLVVSPIGSEDEPSVARAENATTVD